MVGFDTEFAVALPKRDAFPKISFRSERIKGTQYGARSKTKIRVVALGLKLSNNYEGEDYGVFTERIQRRPSC
jgi:hypothetical protein